MARERLDLRIDSLDAEGRGVARGGDGKVVFVEGALPGERVAAEVLRRKSSYDQARALEILEPSAERRAPRCRYFGLCGGCATQHAQVRMQVAAKQRWLEETLARIGSVRPETLLPPLYGAEWGYRQRARLAVRRVERKGGVLVGFHERRSGLVADMDACEVLPARVSALIPALKRLVERLSVRERLPQIELAVGDEASVLVFRHLQPLTAQDETLLRAFGEASGMWIWLQPGGPESAHPFHPAAGRLDYALPEFGLRIAFRPTDFTQVNHAMNRALVARAMRLLDPLPGERIGDLFCGIGNFALPIARLGARVLGIEGSQDLVQRARANAEANGLAAAASFTAANLFAVDARSFAAFGRFDKLLIDPPREGALEVAKALPQDDGPRRIVYVSCHPATLARDAGVLVHRRGYRLAAAGVVNMFPHTAHVESLALFEKGA